MYRTQCSLICNLLWLVNKSEFPYLSTGLPISIRGSVPWTCSSPYINIVSISIGDSQHSVIIPSFISSRKHTMVSSKDCTHGLNLLTPLLKYLQHCFCPQHTTNNETGLPRVTNNHHDTKSNGHPSAFTVFELSTVANRVSHNLLEHPYSCLVWQHIFWASHVLLVVALKSSDVWDIPFSSGSPPVPYPLPLVTTNLFFVVFFCIQLSFLRVHK